MDRKQVSYGFVSTVFLGNRSELNFLQEFISQRGHLTIYIQTFRDLQKSYMGVTTYYMLTIIDNFSRKV